MATRCVWCGVVVDTSDRRKMRKHLGEKCRKYPGREEMDCLKARVLVLECQVVELSRDLELAGGVKNG